MDDRFWMHPKVRAVGNLAAWMWVASIGYSNANATHGRVVESALPLLTEAVGKARKALVERLVTAGLWEACEGGWLIHDYHDYQPTAEASQRLHEGTAERVRRHRERKKAQENEGGNAVTVTPRTRPVSDPPSEDLITETEPPPAEDPVPTVPDPASGAEGTRLGTRETLTKLSHWDARDAAQQASQGALGDVVTRDTIDRLGALLPGLSDQGVTAADFASLGAAIAAGAIRRKTGARIDWAWLVREGRLATLIQQGREWQTKRAARSTPTLAVVRPAEDPAEVTLTPEQVAGRLLEIKASLLKVRHGR